MDWRGYSSKNNEEPRQPDKIYDDSYVSEWGTDYIAKKTQDYTEKERIVTASHSNIYNICNTIAETFGVYCKFEYETYESGLFKNEYQDANGNYWTGRKVTFYNRAINTDNPVFVSYQKNLNDVKRKTDASEVYTKLYVTNVENAAMTNGYVTIGDAKANYMMDNFILNFDYMHEVGAINDWQYNYATNNRNGYPYELRQINGQIEAAYEEYNRLIIERNDIEADLSQANNSYTVSADKVADYEVKALYNQTVSKNKHNSCFVVFAPSSTDSNIRVAQLRFDGIFKDTIIGYDDSEYKNQIFDATQFEWVYSLDEVTKEKQWYGILDDGGFPIQIACTENTLSKIKGVDGKDTDKYNYLYYLALDYNEANKYQKLLDTFKNQQEVASGQQADAADKLEKINEDIDKVEKLITDLQANKEVLNRKFQLIMGPALKEGYWQPSEYSSTMVYRSAQVSNDNPGSLANGTVTYVWCGENPTEQGGIKNLTFKNEQKAYYERGGIGEKPEQGTEPEKVYYPYVVLTDDELKVIQGNLLTTTVHLIYNVHEFELPADSKFPGGYYYVMVDTKKHYYSLPAAVGPVTYRFEFTSSSAYKFKTITTKKVENKNEETGETTTTEATEETEILEITGEGLTPDVLAATDFTPRFRNIGGEMTDIHMSDNAGVNFVYLYTTVDKTKKIVPAFLFTKENIDWNNYSAVTWQINGKTAEAPFTNTLSHEEGAIVVHPRIEINEDNVNSESDLLMLSVVRGEGETIPLTKYYDYSVIINDRNVYLTLKPDATTSLESGIESEYRGMLYAGDPIYSTFSVRYPVSYANEQLYQDAKIVAKDNSYPKYTYEVTVANIPGRIEHYDLGRLIYINDFSLGMRAVSGYISEVSMALDEPWQDSIKIENYSTKFEDLFGSISATAEAMKTNKRQYDIAAAGFSPAGTINADILQNSLNTNDFYLSYSASGYLLGPDGIVLTNKRAYPNGVFGQVRLQGGGVYLSSTVDENGNRIWSSAITPEGINATLIRAGQLDTNLIRILSGDNVAFQWNSDGIYAYYNIQNIDNTSYVKYNKDGLTLMKRTSEEIPEIPYEPDENFVKRLAIDWQGLTIRNDNGDKVLYADNEGNLQLSGTFQSMNYEPGVAGWQINQNGDAEFQSVTVRGKIEASVFSYEEVSAVGGQLYVGPAGMITAAEGFVVTEVGSYYYIQDLRSRAAQGSIKLPSVGRAWAVGDQIKLSTTVKKGDNFYEIAGMLFTIIEVDSDGMAILKSSSTYGDGATSDIYQIVNGERTQTTDSINEAQVLTDIEVVLMATKDGKQGILINAVDDGPCVDVYDNGELKARLGNLNSLQDSSSDDELTKKINGYGLYGENVYLRGHIEASSGTIGPVNIQSVADAVTASEYTIVLSTDVDTIFTNTLTANVTAHLYHKDVELNDMSGFNIKWLVDGAEVEGANDWTLQLEEINATTTCTAIVTKE